MTSAIQWMIREKSKKHMRRYRIFSFASTIFFILPFMQSVTYQTCHNVWKSNMKSVAYQL